MIKVYQGSLETLLPFGSHMRSHPWLISRFFPVLAWTCWSLSWRPRSNGSKLPAPCTAIWLQRWGLSHHCRGDAPRRTELEVSGFEVVELILKSVLAIWLFIYYTLSTFVQILRVYHVELRVRTLHDITWYDRYSVMYLPYLRKVGRKLSQQVLKDICWSLATICSHDAQAWVSDFKCKCHCAHSTRRLESSHL